MIVTSSSSSGTVKESRNPWRRQSESPPSYDAAEAEPHAFIDGKRAMESPDQIPPAPLITGGSSSSSSTRSDPLAPIRKTHESEPSPLYLDPSTGKPLAGYMISDAKLAQCTQHGHLLKTKYSPLSVLAAAVFFPWGLICMMGSRVVYCQRCGLVVRSPRGCGASRRCCSNRRGRC